jgi:hypothetical protein
MKRVLLVEFSQRDFIEIWHHTVTMHAHAVNDNENEWVILKYNWHYVHTVYVIISLLSNILRVGTNDQMTQITESFQLDTA